MYVYKKTKATRCQSKSSMLNMLEFSKATRKMQTTIKNQSITGEQLLLLSVRLSTASRT